MRSREDLQAIVADILTDIRKAAGLSKARMAARCGVDERTYSRYEAGDSSPTLAVFLTMLDGLDAPALPIVLRHLYPGSYLCDERGPAAQARRSVAEYVATDATDRGALQLDYILRGQHGSPLEAQLQLFTALDHLPMDVRLAIAKLVLNAWEIETARGGIINTDRAMPDVDILRQAIIKAQQAVMAGRSSYTTAIK